ncbi:DUF6427 family protein [Bacteroidales bacterium OttesenSCG-928-I21]|nr:DUF6427 family protein [Bacteroidales bacterium OttesenSCG-928-I21]
MIKILRSNNPINFVLMFVIMLGLWALKFIYMPQPIESYEYYSLIFPEFGESLLSQYLSVIVAFIIYYGFAVFLIKTNLELSIVESAYQTPGIFFVMLSGIYVNAQRILPEIIASMLLSMAIISIFFAYKKMKIYGTGFNVGLLYSLSVLVVPKFILFFPLLIFALFVVRPVSMREIVSLIIGFVCPIILAGSIVFLYFDFQEFIMNIGNALTVSYNRISSYNFYVFSPILILAIIVLIAKLFLRVSQSVLSRKGQNVFSIFLLVSIIYFISPFANNELIVILFAPLSILLSYIFVNASKIVATFTFVGLFLGIIALQIAQLYLIY